LRASQREQVTQQPSLASAQVTAWETALVQAQGRHAGLGQQQQQQLG
jgi:hypothetical protein